MKGVFLILKRNISGYFRRNKYMFAIVFTSLCAGAVAGTFGAARGNIPEIMPSDGLAAGNVVMESFLENLKFLVWIVLWGINVAGFPVIIYLLYSKGAVLSASVYALAAMENANHLMLIVSILPYIMCTVAAVMIASQGSLGCSMQLAKSVFFGKKTRNLPNVYKLTAEFVVAAVLTLLGGVCEAVFNVRPV